MLSILLQRDHIEWTDVQLPLLDRPCKRLHVNHLLLPRMCRSSSGVAWRPATLAMFPMALPETRR